MEKESLTKLWSHNLRRCWPWINAVGAPHGSRGAKASRKLVAKEHVACLGGRIGIVPAVAPFKILRATENIMVNQKEP